METIEKATGKQIIRIETNDLDVMEEVSPSPSGSGSRMQLTSRRQQMKKALKS